MDRSGVRVRARAGALAAAVLRRLPGIRLQRERHGRQVGLLSSRRVLLICTCGIALARTAPAQDAGRSLVPLLRSAHWEHAAGLPVCAAEVSGGGDRMPGVMAFAPSRIRIPLSVPPRARLQLSCGLPAIQPPRLGTMVPAMPPRPVRFRAAIESLSHREVVWDVRRDPAQVEGWRTVVIDLARFHGANVELVLETEVDGGVAPAAWGGLTLSAPALPADDATPLEPAVDLLSGARSRPAPVARVIEADVLVPGSAVLEIQAAMGPARWGASTVEPDAALDVHVDGEAVYAWRLRRSFGGLRTRVPLARFAGRRVQVCLRSYGSFPAGLSWRVARVLREVERPREPPPGRNVLLVVVDTLRADRLGAYGHPVTTSPHLDRLSRRGTLQTDCQSQAPWTIPSMASLFTDRYPAGEGSSPRTLTASTVTLAERIRDAGLDTVAVVANPLLDDSEFLRGFKTATYLAHGSASTVHGLFADWIRGRGRRWFAYLHVMEPHHPYEPPAPVRTLLGGGSPLSAEESDVWHRALRIHGGPPVPADVEERLDAAYDGEVLAWDAELGRLLADLQRQRLRDGLVLAIAGDHGEELAEHGLLGHGSQLHRESLHVPLAVDDGEPSRLLHEPRELRRLHRDILAWCGIADEPVGRPEESPTTPSAGTIAVLRGGLEGQEDLGRGAVALTSGSWKYIERPDRGAAELYDRASDPGETQDVAAARPDVTAECRGVLEKALGGRQPEAEAPSPELLEAMRALGYVQ